MPAPGYKSITVPDDVYDRLRKLWEKDKEYYRTEKGIRSFSGFCTYYLSQTLAKEKKRSPK